MALSSFHPLVARWFTETLGEPTPAQARGWAAIRGGRHTLIAAPTGSGKTLAAFLTAIDDLVQEGLHAPLPDEVRVVYVSPLKALSADIHKNLGEPRRGLRHIAASLGVEAPRITAAVRTGDTTAAERAAMLRTPPHILVTTPESLYLLLTAARSRELLRTTRTVIVDEIHAVIGTRRGAHLALSLERLEGLCAAGPPRRIGLSATQKPITEVARFLVGAPPGRGDCAIVDEGHRRALDLAIEIPRSPLGAVLAHEVWEEYYDRLTALIQEHRTTIVFVNTRRLAERVARHLSERLGDEAVTAHHGSLSKETRLDAEHRLKTGALRALVATASLELGIDIGHVDLVCQIGSPHRIAAMLQRVGRSGHTVHGRPKGRFLPVSRDDLVEGTALLRAIRQGELDAIVPHDAPLDVLAQQITAEVACRDVGVDDLFAFVRHAWPYRGLTRTQFDAVVKMVSEGFATRRGRRAALVHRDEVHGVLRGRRGSRMLAITSGGAIPEVADYRVILEPEETFIGTLNEDFAIESMAGDIFQLGNASWQITQVVAGTVRVTDARGAPPTIPFWLGEAPARTDELSRAVSDLRADVGQQLGVGSHLQRTVGPDVAVGGPVEETASAAHPDPIAWLETEAGISRAVAEQVVEYVADGAATLGVVPTQETLVLERFFDESGGMQLVLHAPFGSRVNRAWALALRKRFCRQFNFELQAAATEDAILLSLGPQHSFPLADVFRYLHPSTAHDILVQAFLDAPVFQTRWRWNATISLAVPRFRGGRRVPPQLQRMQSDDLLAAVFPDAAACLENIPGDRVVPDHPLAAQTIRDCLEETADFAGLAALLERIHRGDLRLVTRDTPEPSAFAHEILNARPYQFIDDAPLEERRTQAVLMRRAGAADHGDLGVLDAAAVDRVRDEARPDPRDADELHDVLQTTGCLMPEDATCEPTLFAALASAGRATCVWLRADRIPDAAGRASAPPLVRAADATPHDGRSPGEQLAATGRWICAERLPEFLAVHPDCRLDPPIEPPAARAAVVWTRGDAIVELLRGRLAIVGPTTSSALAAALGISAADAEAALLALETDGAVLRGQFTAKGSRDTVAAPQTRPSVTAEGDGDTVHAAGTTDAAASRTTEWCDRRLLARIHRYTLNRLRAEIAAVSPADFTRFLFGWQHVEPASRLTGPEGLRVVIHQLDGMELPARAWERAVLPARLVRYEPAMLDLLCLTGDVGWARLSTGPTQVVGATPIALYRRDHADAWLALRMADPLAAGPAATLSAPADRILDVLRTRGASFAHELADSGGLDADAFRAGISELVAAGLVTSDGFAGIRAIVGPTTHAWRGDSAGRWAALAGNGDARDAAVIELAWALLRRYGVIFRRLLARESHAVPWRELVRTYRRLEARGEIRGGRFVSGVSGEQFALPDAVDRLREVRRSTPDDTCLAISAADPLNLTGLVTPGERVRATAANRIVYRNGVPLAAMEGDFLRVLSDAPPDVAAEAAAAAAGRRVPVVHGYVGRVR